MSKIKDLYLKNIYGLMGTLLFHILLFSAFTITDLSKSKRMVSEEAILLDFTILEERQKIPDQDYNREKQNSENKTEADEFLAMKQNYSNQGVNDAKNKDNFFDENYSRELEEAKNLVNEVNNQLSKIIVSVKKFAMPEITTEGQNPDSIKNTVYAGKSNIHYNLENRHHIRLPVPVYLAKSGGIIIVDIQVDRSGKVIKAQARKTNESADPMLSIYATQAAESTIFNSLSTTSAIQNGTITYQFVAQ